MRHVQCRKMLALLIAVVVLGFGLPIASLWLPGLSAAGAAMAQGTPAEGGEAAPVDDGRPTTFGDYWKQGGTTMWPLLATLVWATAVFIELLMKLRPKYFCPDNVVRQLTAAMEVADYQKAWRIAMENPSPVSRIFARSIEKLPRGTEAVEEAAAESATEENNAFKTKLSYLSLNAAVAPMLGLFGTISGMISAFNKMAYEGGTGDPTKLASSIGEALITTYAGLVVAIPAMTIFYIIGNRLKSMMTITQNTLTLLLEYVDFGSLPDDLVVVTREMKAAALTGGFSGRKGKGASIPPPAPAAPEKSAKTASSPVAAPAAPAAPAAQMVQCPNCSKEIAVGSKKCPACGTELDWEG